MTDATGPHDRADIPQAGPTSHLGPTFDLFLSYNSQDRTQVLAVRQWLVDHGLATFFDRECLNPGLPWQAELETAIARSRAVAVFLGPNGLGVWQNREMALALDRQVKEEKTGARLPVIPVLLPGFRFDDPRHEPPSLLMLNMGVDLRAGYHDAAAVEPLAWASRRNAPPPTPEGSRGCPYRGLRPFREEDAPLFFGRETFATTLLEKTRVCPLVAVVGPSGSGKSSVVQAGLVPLLRRERPPQKTWGVVVFTPGHRPFHRLAAALIATWQSDVSRRNIESDELGDHLSVKQVPALETAFASALEHSERADRLLVVVDQCEELFTLSPEPDRVRFVEALLAAAAGAPVTLVLTLRADYYSPAISLSRPLSDAIGRGIVNLGPMKGDELRRAVEEPARSVGVAFEPNLVDLILNDVAGQPGRLPLLEFALTELWSRQDGPVLTRRAYEAIGKVEGAIGQTAERVFASLTPNERDVGLRASTRLVHVASANEEGTDTRQRVRLEDLGAAALPVTMIFVEHRLLVVGRDEASGEEVVEVAHEALIRNWGRLKDRLNGDRAFLLWRQELDHLLGFWRRSHDDEVLLRGSALVEARRWARLRHDELNEAEFAFIKRSVHDPSARRRRARAAWAGVLTLAFLGVVIGGLWRWTLSDHYQVREVFRKAPALVRDNDEAAAQWLAAQFVLGREQDTLAAVARTLDPLSYFKLVSSTVDLLHRSEQREAEARAAAHSVAAAERVPDAERRSEMLAEAAGLLVDTGRAVEALALTERIETSIDRASALIRVAVGSIRDGQRPIALRAAEAAATTAGQINDPSERHAKLSYAYKILIEKGRIDLVYARAGRVDDRNEAAWALGSAFLAAQGFAISSPFDSRGLDQRQRDVLIARLVPGVVREVSLAPDPVARSRALVLIVMALAWSDQTKESLNLARQISVPDQRSEALEVVAEILDLKGQAADALPVASEIPDELRRAKLLVVLARSLAKSQRFDEAARAATDVVTLAAKFKNAYERFERLARAAEVLALAGRTDAAADAAADAIAAALIENSYSSTALKDAFKILVKAGRAEAATALSQRFDGGRSPNGSQVFLAAALAEVGQIEAALRLTGETNPGTVMLATSPLSVVGLLIESGNLDRALDLAERVKEPAELTEILAAIAQAQRATGQTEPARETASRVAAAALLVTADDRRADALRLALVALLRSGSTDAVIALADRVSKHREWVVALASAAYDITNEPGSESAVKALALATDAVLKTPAGPDLDSKLEPLALSLIRAGQPEKAVKVAERIESRNGRSETLAEAAKALAGTARTGAAHAVALQVLDDRLRSQALAAVAQAQARQGALLEARATAENCGSLKDRLSAYTAIVTEYYAASDPKWKAVFEKSPFRIDPPGSSPFPQPPSPQSPFDLPVQGQ